MGYLQLCSLNWKLKMVSFKEQISDTFWWIKSSCSAVWFVCSRMYSSQFLLRIHNLWVQYPVMSQPRFHGLYLGFGVPLLHCGIFSLDNAYSLSTISIPFHHFFAVSSKSTRVKHVKTTTSSHLWDINVIECLPFESFTSRRDTMRKPGATHMT